ncbi:MAG: hypothetical protein AAB347_09315 [Bacteroidota bacterium]
MKKTNLKIPNGALVALAIVGSLSVGGLASVTMEWVGSNSAEQYYGSTQLHSAAPASTSPVLWIMLTAIIAVVVVLCCNKFFTKRKNR